MAVIFFKNTLNARERGNSIFASLDQGIYKCTVEKPDGKNEVICLYQVNATEPELLLTIESVFGGAVRYPLFVDFLKSDNRITILLELQAPFSCFLVQKYSREGDEWTIQSEHPIEKIGLEKRQKLVSARVEALDKVVFYFLPEGEYFMSRRADGIVRKRQIISPEDTRVVYDILSSGVQVNGNPYAFEQDHHSKPIKRSKSGEG